ncbi:substrate-binding periplasmic protein [Marinomonas spartinae]|uniref:substrate-binding periplasmic protein n=1 Tax=Marinomonas spartinae TaxID=1792290 RepID=UPI001F438CFF|nr:transporter substrate-binding domain-containing protein [Marinomonas spartinae]
MRLHNKQLLRIVPLMGLLGVLLGAQSVLAQTSTSKEQCHSLTATGNSEYPPFLWRSPNNDHDLLGANAFFIEALSKRIGVPIKLEHVGPWSRAQSEVKSGRIDLMAGAFYTSARADYMDYFSPVILHTTSVVWQRKGNQFPFHSKEDLIGKWGVTVINNSFGQVFDEFAQRHLNILSVASLSQAFLMLAADRVDYVLYEKNPGEAYVAMLGLSGKIVPVEPSISSEGLYLTMSKDSPCNTDELKQKIAKALRDMRQDGVAEASLMKGLKEWDATHVKEAKAFQSLP